MFSVTDAAFSGFRAAREHFRPLLLWIPALAVISWAMLIGMVVFGGPSLMEMQQATPGADGDPAQAMAALRGVGKLYAVLIPVSLVYYGVLYAAVNRMVQRPQDSRTAYLGFGGDEVRQMILLVLMGLLFGVVYLAGVFAIALAAGIVAAAGGGMAGISVGIVGGLGLLGLLTCLGVRLSLASAHTFATGQISLFGAWALTRGRFWPMLGAYLLAAVLGVVVLAAVWLIQMAAMATLGGGMDATSQILAPDISSLAAYLTPGMIAYVLINNIAAPFLMLIFTAPGPTIYRSLTSASLPSAFD